MSDMQSLVRNVRKHAVRLSISRGLIVVEDSRCSSLHRPRPVTGFLRMRLQFSLSSVFFFFFFVIFFYYESSVFADQMPILKVINETTEVHFLPSCLKGFYFIIHVNTSQEVSDTLCIF